MVQLLTLQTSQQILLKSLVQAPSIHVELLEMVENIQTRLILFFGRYFLESERKLSESIPHDTQGIFQLFHACDSRTHEAALFQNIFKFCTFLPKFSNILPFFALSLKNCTHAVSFWNRLWYCNIIQRFQEFEHTTQGKFC